MEVIVGILGVAAVIGFGVAGCSLPKYEVSNSATVRCLVRAICALMFASLFGLAAYGLSINYNVQVPRFLVGAWLVAGFLVFAVPVLYLDFQKYRRGACKLHRLRKLRDRPEC